MELSQRLKTLELVFLIKYCPNLTVRAFFMRKNTPCKYMTLLLYLLAFINGIEGKYQAVQTEIKQK